MQDTGLIQGITQAGPTVSFAEMAKRQKALAAEILRDPDVVSLSSFIGVDGANATLNSGRFLINLKPKDQRERRLQDTLAQAREGAERCPGISLYLQPVQDLTIDSTVSRAAISVRASGRQFGNSRTRRCRASWRSCLRRRSLPMSRPIFWTRDCRPMVTVDRDTAARFGITAATIDNALYDAFGQRIISTIFTQSNQYRVILEANPDIQNSVASLYNIYLPSAGGGQVPLSALAHVDIKPMPLEIDHLGQFPAATISFDVASGYSLGAAVDAVRRVGKGCRPAGDHQHGFPGFGAGVPVDAR